MNLINRFFNRRKEPTMTETEKLNSEIAAAEQAASDSQNAADTAQKGYDEAIEAGDMAKAAQAQQDRDQHERAAQMHRDRAAALESRRPAAEQADATPAAHAAIEAAQRSAAEEQAAIAAFQQAAETLVLTTVKLADAAAQTDEHIATAHEAIRAAHLFTHPGVDRPRFSVDAARLIEMAKKAAWLAGQARPPIRQATKWTPAEQDRLTAQWRERMAAERERREAQEVRDAVTQRMMDEQAREAAETSHRAWIDRLWSFAPGAKEG